MKRIVRFCLEHHDIFFYALMKHFHFLNVVTYIKHLLNGMGVVASFCSQRHQLFPKTKWRAIVGIEGNNKLAITQISSQ